MRVTTDAGLLEAHADSMELWSPGAPVFPEMAELRPDDDTSEQAFQAVLPR
ncbi:MAG: hypothetical protein H6842_10245 [Rhodospirillaceae bacterium]|nr:hypothetical protein [Rhodospirillaceae bacterium]